MAAGSAYSLRSKSHLLPPFMKARRAGLLDGRNKLIGQERRHYEAALAAEAMQPYLLDRHAAATRLAMTTKSCPLVTAARCGHDRSRHKQNALAGLRK
jgi:hypothetical protein